jgi:prophage regulatory protein
MTPIKHPDRLLRLADVVARCGVCRSTIYRMIKSAQFPPPRKAGAASRWRESDVQAWVAGEWQPAQCDERAAA